LAAPRILEPRRTNVPSSLSKLRIIKVAHTAVWAGMVSCILGIPAAAWRGSFSTAAALAGVVLLEVLVLAFNKGVCPLTPMAARLTEVRRDNFDIYLPEWLARHNKGIFGTLYGLGVLVALLLWHRASL
jgi:hypothetical protein